MQENIQGFGNTQKACEIKYLFGKSVSFEIEFDRLHLNEMPINEFDAFFLLGASIHR